MAVKILHVLTLYAYLKKVQRTIESDFRQGTESHEGATSFASEVFRKPLLFCLAEEE